MATERLRTIKPAGQGGDYTTLSAWEAGEQADLVALDEYRIGEIDGDWSAAAALSGVTVEGWVTDITRYVEIRAIGSARHLGKWTPTACRIEIGFGSAIQMRTGYTRVFGLQAKSTFSSGTSSIFYFPTFENGLSVCDGCISVAVNTGSALIRGFATAYVSGGEVRWSNLISYGDLDYGFYSLSTGVVSIYNCSVIGANIGYKRDGGTLHVKNCLAQLCRDGYQGNFTGTCAYNISDISSDAPGTNPVTGSVQFIDAANGDFRLSPYDTVAMNAGANLYSDATYPVTTDIAGNSRGTSSAASYDIGASHATTRIRTIKPSGQGGTYTSLSAWESAEQADLPSLNKIVVGEIRGNWSSADGTVDIDGWTTDATRYIIVRTVGTARHAGQFTSNAYCIEGTRAGDNGQISIREQNVLIDGLQVFVTAHNDTDQQAVRVAATGNIKIENCIFKGVTGTGGYYSGMLVYESGSSTLFVSNCIFYGFRGSTASGFLIYDSTPTVYIYSCTFYDCDEGISNSSVNTVSKNCIVQNCTDGFTGTFAASSTNNCSDIASDAPGTNPITGTVTFVDAANEDFHLHPLDIVAKGNGINLSNDATYPFNTDIDGEPRYTVRNWDIGADQTKIVAVRHPRLKGVTKLHF